MVYQMLLLHLHRSIVLAFQLLQHCFNVFNYKYTVVFKELDSVFTAHFPYLDTIKQYSNLQKERKEKKQKERHAKTNKHKQTKYFLFGCQKSVWVKDAFLLEFLCLLLFSDHSSSKETWFWCFPECFSCRPVMFTGKLTLLLSGALSHRRP